MSKMEKLVTDGFVDIVVIRANLPELGQPSININRTAALRQDFRCS